MDTPMDTQVRPRTGTPVSSPTVRGLRPTRCRRDPDRPGPRFRARAAWGVRALLGTVALILLAAACGDSSTSAGPAGPAPSTTASPSTTRPTGPTSTTAGGGRPTTTPPTTSETPGSTGAETTTAAPPPSTVAPTSAPTTSTAGPEVTFDPALTERTWAVVLVEDGDVLNVRSGPGVSNPVIASFGPTDTGIMLTGNQAMVGSSRWVEITGEEAGGWASSVFLTPEYTDQEVLDEWDHTSAPTDLAARIAAGGDLAPPVSHRGLYVNLPGGTLQRLRPSELTGIMTDPSTRFWGGTQCDTESCPEETFADAVGLPYLGTWEDVGADAVVEVDGYPLGGNGPFPPETAIPTPFRNFHWVAVHDPGDDPDFGGLDWMTWFVFLEPEGSSYRVVGLTSAEWSP